MSLTLHVTLKENTLSHSLTLQNLCTNQEDQNLQLRERLEKVLPTHAKNFEPRSFVGCHSCPKNELLPFSFMPHTVLP